MTKASIMIQSQSFDSSTDTVLMWLYYYGNFNKIHLFFNDYAIENFSLLFSDQKKKPVCIANFVIYVLIVEPIWWLRKISIPNHKNVVMIHLPTNGNGTMNPSQNKRADFYTIPKNPLL